MINPLVSVIIPNYNHSQYLENRIVTVLNQTYQNIEVIILDDKSNDNSLEVIERYRNHPKVALIVVNEQNTGSPFKQWDKGINLAKGELIWIAESDDYNELTFLEEMITEWGKHKDVVVAFSNYVLFGDGWCSKNKERKTRCYTGEEYVCKRLARRNYILNASGVVFANKAYQNISKEYLTYKSAGDFHFWVELLRHGNVIRLGKNLTYFRQNNTSVTGTNGTKGIVSAEDKRVYDYICANYSLSALQKRIVNVEKFQKYQTEHYDSEDIRMQVFSLWNINTNQSISKLDKFMMWLVGSLERHFGILI